MILSADPVDKDCCGNTSPFHRLQIDAACKNENRVQSPHQIRLSLKSFV
ncbi:Uncharacterised protein [Vibrio cholerae]|nr:Uncharacterised protein [Vibrio cholerae]